MWCLCLQQMLDLDVWSRPVSLACYRLDKGLETTWRLCLDSDIGTWDALSCVCVEESLLLDIKKFHFLAHFLSCCISHLVSYQLFLPLTSVRQRCCSLASSNSILHDEMAFRIADRGQYIYISHSLSASRREARSKKKTTGGRKIQVSVQAPRPNNEANVSKFGRGRQENLFDGSIRKILRISVAD